MLARPHGRARVSSGWEVSREAGHGRTLLYVGASPPAAAHGTWLSSSCHPRSCTSSSRKPSSEKEVACARPSLSPPAPSGAGASGDSCGSLRLSGSPVLLPGGRAGSSQRPSCTSEPGAAAPCSQASHWNRLLGLGCPLSALEVMACAWPDRRVTQSRESKGGRPLPTATL